MDPTFDKSAERHYCWRCGSLDVPYLWWSGSVPALAIARELTKSAIVGKQRGVVLESERSGVRKPQPELLGLQVVYAC